jgi:hypothetical protein
MTVTDEQVARPRDHFTDAELVELTYLVALENQRRSNHALSITAPGYTSGDACPLPVDEQISEAAQQRTTGAGSATGPAPVPAAASRG